jgi:hypothetical protein
MKRVTQPVSIEDFETLKQRVKTIEAFLELTPIITTFEWKWNPKFPLSEQRIKLCLCSLYNHPEGLTTTQIAKEIGLPYPQASGRTIVSRQLSTIEKVSKRLKGVSIIMHVGKYWKLNTVDFAFKIEKIAEQKQETKEVTPV